MPLGIFTLISSRPVPENLSAFGSFTFHSVTTHCIATSMESAYPKSALPDPAASECVVYNNPFLKKIRMKYKTPKASCEAGFIDKFRFQCCHIHVNDRL